MNDEYLVCIEKLISDGNNVLETKIVKDTPGKTKMAKDVMGIEYPQKRIPRIHSESVDDGKYTAWITGILAYLQNHFQSSAEVYSDRIKAEDHKNALSNYARARIIVDILIDFRDKVKYGIVRPDLPLNASSSISNIDIIFNKFHNVVRQLRTRHDKRKTLLVDDEYDVQDLLHALLFLFFEDVRSEEVTPSFAGASARMDFLLKNEKVVIEVKKTRKSMTDKTLGNELIEDVARYQAHPDCDKLICFVYDPEGLLGNPNGIMNDLNAQHKGFVDVVIRPL